MKLYVISDTHGKVEKAIEIYNELTDVDFIIHLGDMERDARKISETTGKTVISVRGNNEAFSSKPDFHILETDYGNIFITHGHIQNVKRDLQNLVFHTQESDCKAALFGHTHIPFFTKVDELYLLNPGSLTFPAYGHTKSYAVLDISKDEFSASIVNL